MPFAGKDELSHWRRLSNTGGYGYRVPEIERICNPAAKWASGRLKKLLRIVQELERLSGWCQGIPCFESW